MTTSAPRPKRAGIGIAAVLAVLVVGTFLYLWVFEKGPFHSFNRPRTASVPIDVGLYRLKISYVSFGERPEVDFRYHSLPGGESPGEREFVEAAPPPVPFVVGDASRRRPEVREGLAGYGGIANTAGDAWKERIGEAGVPVIPNGGGKREDNTGTLTLNVRILEETKETVTFRVAWEANKDFRYEVAGTKTPLRAHDAVLDFWSSDWYTVKRSDREAAVDYATRLCVSNFIREYQRQNRESIP